MHLPKIFVSLGIALQVTVLVYGQNTPASTYQPPVFTDTARMQKLSAAFPVVEKIYKDYAKAHQFPGFTFGIIAEGKLVHSGSFGYTNIENKTPVSTKSVFRIASMTKSLTALAILQLRDAGKLRLDDPAQQYVPSLKEVKYLTKDSPPITIRHLLTHSAGFPEDNPWGDRQLDETDKMLQQMVAQGVSFSNAPGVAYEYSNLGFALLGSIITQVSGKPYQQYIKDNILTPLNMQDTYWEYANVPAKQLAHGYRPAKAGWQEETLLHDGSFGAMGGMISSLEDFSRYMALHLSAWPPRDEEEPAVIRRSSLREMQQPQRISYFNPEYTYPDGQTCAVVGAYGYGLGWVQDCEDRVRVGHSGGLPGFGSNWLILPEYGIGLVCFANLTYAPTSTVNIQVMDTLFALADLLPRVLPVSAILQQRKAQLMKVLPGWQQARESGLFAENFFLDNPLDSLKKLTKEKYAAAGKIVRVQALQAENQLRGFFILEGERKNLRISFTLSPEHTPLIQAFDITLP